MAFTKNRFQKLAGILKESKKPINEELDAPRDFSELQDWLDRRPGVSAKVAKLIEEEEDESKAAEWLLTNFDYDLSMWSGKELVEFLEQYTTSNDEHDDDDYDDRMDGDFDSAMASAGFGTDEDYGFSGGEDW